MARVNKRPGPAFSLYNRPRLGAAPLIRPLRLALLALATCQPESPAAVPLPPAAAPHYGQPRASGRKAAGPDGFLPIHPHRVCAHSDRPTPGSFR